MNKPQTITGVNAVTQSVFHPRSDMSSYTTKCPGCKKVFKTFYSLKKHVRERHEDISEDTVIPEFFDQEGVLASLPIPREDLDQESKEGYRMWLDGIIERMSSTFHPRLPGKLNDIF